MASPAVHNIPDFFSTLSTKDLQEKLRNSQTLELETLLNSDRVEIDLNNRRVFRDSFWKGSFAKDTLLGWQEKIASLGSFGEGSPIFAGGSFWKRFDRLEEGVAKGLVINYEVDALPGRPEVRAVRYPKSNRKYFQKGDNILLLTYLNAPYRIVYDTIKVIDSDSAIGVMHLGRFPNGLEFATFVMERHNYPFEKMAVKDYEAILALESVKPAQPAQLQGKWEGHLLSNEDPDRVLLHKSNPHGIRLKFEDAGSGLKATYQFRIFSAAGTPEKTTELQIGQDAASPSMEFHLSPHGDLFGRMHTKDWKIALLPGMHKYVDSAGDDISFHFVAKRSGNE